MTDDAEDKRAAVAQEAAQFLRERRSLIMATVDAEAMPEASYAPFVRTEDNAFYVYVSDLARHTRNLREQSRVSILLIEDEQSSAQLFARKRLTFQCDAHVVERETPKWTEVLDSFDKKFGQVMDMLRPLTDFHLWRLQPKSGRFVKGFAQAFRIEGATLDEFRHINDAGHSTKPT
ncbi:MAG: pyridoxamine 5'-phosphate oxidase family protein [Gammaproteobacteria bacterium]|nr:pyridoxamine 5'-phosphate oxidase family protein [Gammaproteobacteria bacterium]